VYELEVVTWRHHYYMDMFLRRSVEVITDVINLINLHAFQCTLNIGVHIVLQSRELVVRRVFTNLDHPDIEILSVKALESDLILFPNSLLERTDVFGLLDFNGKDFPANVAVNKAIKGDFRRLNL